MTLRKRFGKEEKVKQMTNWFKKNAFELTIRSMFFLLGVYIVLIIRTPDSFTVNIVAVILSGVMLTSVVWSIVRIVKKEW